MLLLALGAPWAAWAQTYTASDAGIIGTGTSAQYYAPFNLFYKTYLTQQIYTADEIGTGAATIKTISFQFNYTTSATIPSFTLYLGNTTKSTFSSTTDWISLSDMTNMGTYSSISTGSTSGGWVTITLNSTFSYNGDNLVVCCYDNTVDSYPGSSYTFRYTSTSSNYRTLYAQSDSSAPTTSSSGSRTYNRPNIKLNIGSTSVTTSSGTFYDSGGSSGDYSIYEDYVWTFYPATSGNFVKLDFTSFITEGNNWDYLRVYDGTSTSATELAYYNSSSSGTNMAPLSVTATNSSGALTVKWHSDSSNTYAGFVATVSNVSPPRLTYSASPSAGGTVTVTQNGSTISSGTVLASGSSLDITATPASGYVFNGWTVSGTGASVATPLGNPTTLTMGTANTTLTANFVQGYVISESGDITTCSGTIFDSGGAGYYNDNENYTRTIYPGTSGNMVQLVFSTFETEGSWDYLDIYDGTSTSATLIGQYYGSTSPGTVTASNSSGALTLHWYSDSSNSGYAGFAADISCVEPTPVLSVGAVGITTAALNWTGVSSSYTVRYGTLPLYANFETGDMSQASFTYSGGNWTTSTTSPYNGSYCAKSGNAGTGSSTSYMEVSVTLSSAAELRFAAKISSEGSYDKGYFYIDGTVQSDLNGISGAGSWNTYSYPLAAGTHTLKWAYTKDSSVNNGDDCFYVDDIQVFSPPTTVAATTSANSYTLTGLTANTTYVASVQGTNSAVSNYVFFTTLPTSDAYPISGSGDVTTCSGIFTDSNPSGNYSNNESYTRTFYPGTQDHAVQMTFLSFDTEGADYLYVYDGTSTSATQIGVYSGHSVTCPFTVKATNSAGALTFRFTSDGSIVYPGWEAEIACVEPKPVLTVSNITTNSATASWTGASSSYTLRYGAVNPFADFETGDMSQASFTYSGGNWTTSTTSPYNGSYCAKSGNAGTASSTSYMEISVTLSNPGVVSFAAKISSESGWDKGYFYINDVVQSDLNGISGAGSWQTYSYSLAADTYTFKWAYSKDGSTNSNDDCFYVDDIMVSDLANTATTSSTSYNMTGLTMGTWYMATVQGANSDMSNPVVFQTPSTHTLTASVNPANSGTISANGATISGATTYNHGTSVTLTANAATGYTFQNWTIDGSTVSGASTTITMDQDHTVVANFTLNQYTVTLNVGTGGTATGGGTYNEGTTANIEAFPDACHTFSHFIDDNNTPIYGFNPAPIVVDHDMTITVVFAAITYNVSATASPSAGGTVTGGGTLDCGSSCTLTATPATNYVFDNWTENSTVVSSNASYNFTVNGDRTLLANFHLDAVNITATAYDDSNNTTGGGTISGTGSFNIGSTCTLVATPASGYHFVNWTENNLEVATTANYSFTVTTARDLVAHFTQDEYTLTLVADPVGGGTVSASPAGPYHYNDVVTVTATPNSGYIFGSWSDGGTAQHTVTITGNTTLTAYFGADQTLTTYANPIEGGYVTIAENQVSTIGAVEVGNPSAEGVQNVSSPYWTATSYSFEECLYLASEIGVADAYITSISYYVRSSSSASSQTDDRIEVYMKNTNRTSFSSSNSDMEAVTANDKVFDGTWHLTNTTGWVTIVLDKPFHYTGSTLMIGIHEMTQGSSNITFKFTDTQEMMGGGYSIKSVYKSDTQGDIDPTALTSLTNKINNRANVRLGFGTYHYGQSVTLTAHANDGYQFVNWTENSTEVGTHGNATYTVTMDADHTIYANFERLAKRFVTNGSWDNGNNWLPTGAPDITEDVSIEAAATIPSGVVATANEITINGGSITIQDGGQLQHNNAASSMVTVTAQNTIAGYTSADAYTNKGYELVSFPVDNLTVNSSAITGLVTSDPYDFYRFDASADPLEWRQMASTDNISLLQGFIYASQEGTTISVTGPVLSSATPVNSASVAYVTANAPRFNGWALLGNPFVCNAYVSLGNGNGAGSETNFYKLNHTATYDEFVPFTNSDAVNPMGGVMFRVFNNDNIVYSRTASSGAKTGILNMDVTCVKDRATVTLDRARVRFGEGRNLEKLQFDTRHTKVYIPEGGNDFSVYYADGAGTIPVNFKAQDNGRYTLDFSTEDVGFNYLHLIDNMNGNDVDLLQTPYYAFDAKSTDFASRFTLVFATGNDNDDTFAFFNNGVWIINNDGEATLQVVDALGRMLSSESISGSTSKAINVAPGVYMLRLINGDKVKVQKIVVKR